MLPFSQATRSENGWATDVRDLLLWTTSFSHEMPVRLVTSFTSHKIEAENYN